MRKSDDLTSISTVGDAVAESLVARGIDSVDKLAATDPHKLAGIKGLPTDLIENMIAEAKVQVEEDQKQSKTLVDLIEETDSLKDDVETLVLHIRDRHIDGEVTGKERKQLRKEIALILASLERVETALSQQLHRLGKSLAKADAKLSQVSATENDIEAILVSLKKARKKIDKAVD